MIQRIAILAFDGISSFHLAIPYTVFGEDRTEIGLPKFEVTLCALEPWRVRSSMGFEMSVSHNLQAFMDADVVIIPSWTEVDKPAPRELIGALRAAHQAGKIIVGLCLGAFVVAEAGLLDGRKGTTHWAWAESFRKRFPQVTLDPLVLYIDHGDVITSAGTAAGLDCCLHLLRKACGAELANRLARRLVIPPHRQGGQAQYVEQPVQANGGAARISQTLDWARGCLDTELNIDKLASHAAMGRRTFTRHFQKATGMTVLQWLTQQRLYLVQRLLESTDIPIERISGMAGFGSALSLRLAFMKELKTTPNRYRQEFRGKTTVL